MLSNKTVLAIVPARSKSRGLPNKNMRCLAGHSLIGLAGMVLGKLPFIDCAIISTDSTDYAREAERYGLAAPFLRPDDLSTDTATAIDVVAHALARMERADGLRYDHVLIIEPTSPLRLPSDVMATAALLVEAEADSAITVSEVPSKFHPASGSRPWWPRRAAR